MRCKCAAFSLDDGAASHVVVDRHQFVLKAITCWQVVMLETKQTVPSDFDWRWSARIKLIGLSAAQWVSSAQRLKVFNTKCFRMHLAKMIDIGGLRLTCVRLAQAIKCTWGFDAGRRVKVQRSEYIGIAVKTHPFGHLVGVSVAMMVVEYENRRHDRRSHHEHYAIEVGSCAEK